MKSGVRLASRRSEKGGVREIQPFLNWNFSHIFFSEAGFQVRCSGGQRPMSPVAMNSGMRKAKAPTPVPRPLRILLAGGSERDFIQIRELLMPGKSGHLCLDHVASPAGVLNEKGEGRYDLLL